MSARSMYGIDVMYRLWDAHRSCWYRRNGRSIWVVESQVHKLRDQLIQEGRNPDHLTIKRVHVGVA